MQIFSGRFKSRKILSPKGEKTRPTSGKLREALFNICHSEIEGASFLDLFAGSGAMGVEALSRGAHHVTFVDNSRESIRCIQSNLSLLEIENNADVIYSDVFEAMRKLSKRGRSFDLIYADPPYNTLIRGQSFSTRVLVVLDELIDMQLPLLKEKGRLFLEDAIESIPDEGAFKHLILKDKRNMGRSALQCWSYYEKDLSHSKRL